MKEKYSASINYMLYNIYQYSHAYNLPSSTSCYKSYVFSFVNLLTIARPTKRSMIVSDLNFDWQGFRDIR